MKKNIEKILFALEHKDYYLNMNSDYDGKLAINIKWFEEKAPIQIHEFRELFEDRLGDKYYLEHNNKLEYWIIKH